MVTIVEHPIIENEKYEFKEARAPDELGPDWTVHAIIHRQRVETAYVTKQHYSENGNYMQSGQDQVALVVSDSVYLMRRRVDRSLELAEQKVTRREKEVVEQSKRILDLETKLMTLTNQRNTELHSHSEQMRVASIRADELVRRCEKASAMESDLAKLRDHLGKERFNQIIGAEKA